MIRKDILYNGGVYHIYNKSIAGFKIFQHDYEFTQITRAIKYYQLIDRPCKLSNLERHREIKEMTADLYIDNLHKVCNRSVNILAYCIMPTHFHFLIEQLTDNGISEFLRNIQNSYTRFFNINHHRKGPLWQGPFQNKEIDNDDILLHISRYIHLNPSTAYLVDNPSLWPHSSYHEYLGDNKSNILNFKHMIDLSPEEYRIFVENQIDYQRTLKRIKDYILD